MAIPKREATTILNSLSAGVTPRVGLRHIAVGRINEVTALKKDLEQISFGGATIRFVIGRYGSGKSFLLQLLRNYALESKFVVADADFSPERRLFGSGGEAIATYRELIRNLSIQTRPDGNALPTIIEKWISGIQSKVAIEQTLPINSKEFVQAVQSEIFKTLDGMQEMVHGFDFAQVINSYFKGYIEGDDTLKNNATRWLRGEYTNKSEAYSTLKVRAIIDGNNYYDYLKTLAYFIRDVGYSGLLICFDEAAYLYKISNSISRKNNYETILSILNDCLQGKAGSIGFVFGGTPEFLEDQRRGIFSYEALRTRLSVNRYVTSEMKDLFSPVLYLPSLANEEIFVLLQKLRDIYDGIPPIPEKVTDSLIQSFMQENLKRMGANKFTTPRELIRDFISILNLLVQYPDKSWEEVTGSITPATVSKEPNDLLVQDETKEDILDRFKDIKVG